MVSRLCRKETFILYIYLSIFYHVRFPGGCYSLNPNSNPQNSIHFGSQAIEKHFHRFLFCHTYLSQLFSIMYQPRYTNLHLRLFVVPPLWSIRKCLLRKGIRKKWGLIPCHGYGIDLGQIGTCINEWVEIKSTRWSISVMTPFFT